MAAGSTRHIEPLLPTAVEDTTRVVPHQVSTCDDPRRLQKFQVVRWGGAAGLVDETRVVPHLVVKPAATPLPQGDFSSWQPPLPQIPPDHLWPHQVCLPPEDPRRQQRFTLFRQDIGRTPAEARVVPHQVVVLPDDPRRRFLYPAVPHGGATEPQLPVPFQVIPAAQDARGRWLFRVVRWGGPAGIIDTTRVVPHGVSVAPEDPRRFQRFQLLRFGGPFTPEAISELPRFGPPSPTSGAGHGTPDARHWPGSPSSGAGEGTPDADRYGPPSPERVRV